MRARVRGRATTTLKLFTNLTVLPYRNPFLLAKSVATLDLASGGRTILGAGVGYLEAEYEALGVPFEERNERFDESLVLLRAAWTGRTVTVESPRFRPRGNTRAAHAGTGSIADLARWQREDHPPARRRARTGLDAA